MENNQVTDSANLSHAKASYKADLDNILAGNDGSLLKQEEVDFIFDSLTEDEQDDFGDYQTRLTAGTYDWFMKEFSPEVRTTIDAYIADHVNVIEGGDRLDSEGRKGLIENIRNPDDLLLTMMLIKSDAVRCVIYNTLFEKGWTTDRIVARVSEMNAADRSKAA